MDPVTRRTFLKYSCLALGASFTPSLTSWQVAEAAPVADPSDYRALVCVFLFGGNDAFNTVVPLGGSEHAAYATARQSLAIPAGNLLGLPSTDFGLHPSLPELHQLFQAGDLAILANVGPLLYPTTRAEYLDGAGPLPPRLFSHNDQERHWHTALPASLERTGWAGRAADLLGDSVMNISLGGTNVLQRGRQALPLDVDRRGVDTLRGLSAEDGDAEARRRQAFLALLQDRPSAHPFARALADVQRRAMTDSERISTALADLDPLNTEFPEGRLADQLGMVARMIAIRAAFGASRQIFFVGLGGWDTHGEQLVRHPLLLEQLSQSLGAFQTATRELGVADQVVTFTCSDFGRTLTSNGDGSDHGWGGHAFILGGCVEGGRIHGTMPTLVIDGPDDTRSGRLIPTTSVDQYGATLCRWLGLSDAQLAEVFPNLSRFSPADLGFL